MLIASSLCFADWSYNPYTRELDLHGILGSSTTVPSSSTAIGYKGQLAYDTSYYYICVDTDTWRRVAIDQWPTEDDYIVDANGDNIIDSLGNALVN